MEITLIGVIVFLTGCWLLWRGSTVAMLNFLFVCVLFGGSATVKLTAIGNTSIPPAILAALFLTLRCLWPGPGRPAALTDAVRANGALIAFVCYGVLSAIILPRLFANTIMMPPLRPVKNNFIYAVYPLRPSTQNLTTAVYLTMTMLGSISAYVACRREDAPARLARIISVCGILHASFGFLSVLGRGTPLDAVFEFIRNGNYAQLDQDVGGVVRMAGVLPEPSIFCLTGLILFAFVTELWLRNVDRWWSGTASVLLLAALLSATATTGYVGLTVWIGLCFLRIIAFPGALGGRKYLAAGLLVAIALVGIAALLFARPDLPVKIADVLQSVTVNKLDSRSGTQRLFYMQKGLEAFVHSGGLGIGAGSFRSSGMTVAIIGSMGILGITLFLVHFWRMVQPLRRSTLIPSGDLRTDVSAAASWGVLLMVFPMSLSWPTPDPGLVMGALGGAAMALRRAPVANRASSAWQRMPVPA